jgi:hypothetical protein
MSRARLSHANGAKSSATYISIRLENASARILIHLVPEVADIRCEGHPGGVGCLTVLSARGLLYCTEIRPL